MEAVAPFIINFMKRQQQRALDARTWTEVGKWRNWTFDAMFYDVRRVPPDLWNECIAEKIPEGTIVLLQRTGSAKEPSGRQLAFVDKQERQNAMANVQAVAIPGVGSSVLGTVALAADVADALGGNVTVAGIVTGEGRQDVGEEGLGGWYVLRQANLIRQGIEDMADLAKLFLDRTLGIPGRITDQLFSTSLPDTRIEKLPESEDIVHLIKNAPKLKLIVAHSKGGLYLANALCQIADAWRQHPAALPSPEELRNRLTIVTLGAVIYPPMDLLPCMHQFIGEYDAFGELNSRHRVERTVIPAVMHHLNSALPFHMSCQKVLRSHFPELLSKS